MVATYRVLTGIDYPPGKRAEAGDVVDDLPGKSIKWLVECGAVEKVDGKAAKGKMAEAVVEEPVADETPVDEDATPWAVMAVEDEEDKD